ncbi:signal peptidase II [Simkania sp.]|uniref:signal peptidase II n=1 Tax=Simkania sp. TaxID=34094 RepID=UPI003B52E7C4
MKKDFSRKRRFFPFLLTGAVLLLIDMISKFWVFHGLANMLYASPFYPYGGIGVFENVLGIDFCINRVTNHGGAWGIFGSFPIVLLIVRIAILISVMIYVLFINEVKKRQIPLLLIITGALGNILDRFIYGSVVDMFHFTLWGYSFPVFNVADTLIFLGVATLIIQSLFQKKKTKHVPRFSR